MFGQLRGLSNYLYYFGGGSLNNNGPQNPILTLVPLRQTPPTSFGSGIGAPRLPHEDLEPSASPVSPMSSSCSSPWSRSRDAFRQQDAAARALQAHGFKRRRGPVKFAGRWLLSVPPWKRLFSELERAGPHERMSKAHRTGNRQRNRPSACFGGRHAEQCRSQ